MNRCNIESPLLVSNRLYLRSLVPDDLEGSYFSWLNDQEVTRWMQNGIFPNSQSYMQDYYQAISSSQTDMLLAIITKLDKRHIGNIGLSKLHQVFRSAEIGILIGEKDSWGKGYAAEAICLLVGHGFRRMNLNRVYAGAVVDNIACIKAFENAGFVREGISRQAYYCESQYRDCVNMGLLKSEWDKLVSVSI